MKYKFEPFLTQFWVDDVTPGVKTAIFPKSDLRNNFLPSKFHQTLISMFSSPSYMIYNFGSFFTQFGENGITKEMSIPEF